MHYLPHHTVLRRVIETTRLRVVYNASSKSNGVSLNSCLYPGPSLSRNIFDILIRFPSFKITMVSDIYREGISNGLHCSRQECVEILMGG